MRMLDIQTTINPRLSDTARQGCFVALKALSIVKEATAVARFLTVRLEIPAKAVGTTPLCALRMLGCSISLMPIMIWLKVSSHSPTSFFDHVTGSLFLRLKAGEHTCLDQTFNYGQDHTLQGSSKRNVIADRLHSVHNLLYR